MWIHSRILAVVFVLVTLIMSAAGDGICTGLMRMGFDGIGCVKKASGGGGGCAGVIDLSAGCALPMLGGL
jgi:hypothetical protein